MASDYATRPFGCAGKEAVVAVSSMAGHFLVEDSSIARIVRALERRVVVSAEELMSLCVSESSDPPEGIVKYLVDELQLIVPIDAEFKRVHVVAWTRRMADTAAAVLPSDYSVRCVGAFDEDGDCFEEIRPDDICLLILGSGHDMPAARGFVERLGGGVTISVMFHVQGRVVITPAWSPCSYVPCPSCVYDYAVGRVMSSSTDTLMTLSDVIDIILVEVGDVPEVPMTRDDLYFALTIAQRQVEAMSGQGARRYARFEPGRATVVDLERRHWQSTDIPFSPQCDCLARASEARHVDTDE